MSLSPTGRINQTCNAASGSRWNSLLKQLRLQSCQIPDFARPGQHSTSLSVAWIRAEPGWLEVFVCLGWNSCSLAQVEAKPSAPLSRGERCGCSLHLSHLSWQESHEGSVPLVGWARISLSGAGGDRVKAAVVFQIYICIMGCSCFTCFSKTYATKWAVCVDFNYAHWLLLA